MTDDLPILCVCILRGYLLTLAIGGALFGAVDCFVSGDEGDTDD